MQTIALSGSKPGAGKTTLAVELAVCAEHALILDLHPQRGATAWAQRRESDWPVVHPMEWEDLDDVLAEARYHGFRWVFLDTAARASPEALNAVIGAADRVLIPSRPGFADLGALRGIAESIPLDKQGAIVLNASMPFGGRIRDQLMREAFAEAGRYGLPVAPSVITERPAFSKALGMGRAVVETEPDGKAAADVLGLWAWLCEEAEALVA